MLTVVCESHLRTDGAYQIHWLRLLLGHKNRSNGLLGSSGQLHHFLLVLVIVLSFVLLCKSLFFQQLEETCTHGSLHIEIWHVVDLVVPKFRT